LPSESISIVPSVPSGVLSNNFIRHYSSNKEPEAPENNVDLDTTDFLIHCLDICISQDAKTEKDKVPVKAQNLSFPSGGQKNDIEDSFITKEKYESILKENHAYRHKTLINQNNNNNINQEKNNIENEININNMQESTTSLDKVSWFDVRVAVIKEFFKKRNSIINNLVESHIMECNSLEIVDNNFSPASLKANNNSKYSLYKKKMNIKVINKLNRNFIQNIKKDLNKISEAFFTYERKIKKEKSKQEKVKKQNEKVTKKLTKINNLANLNTKITKKSFSYISKENNKVTKSALPTETNNFNQQFNKVSLFNSYLINTIKKVDNSNLALQEKINIFILKGMPIGTKEPLNIKTIIENPIKKAASSQKVPEPQDSTYYIKAEYDSFEIIQKELLKEKINNPKVPPQEGTNYGIQTKKYLKKSYKLLSLKAKLKEKEIYTFLKNKNKYKKKYIKKKLGKTLFRSFNNDVLNNYVSIFIHNIKFNKPLNSTFSILYRNFTTKLMYRDFLLGYIKPIKTFLLVSYASFTKYKKIINPKGQIKKVHIIPS